MYKIYIARQAVYKKNLDIFGYELLARNDDSSNINTLPSDIATARVLSEVFNQFGLNNIVDGHAAILKLSKRSLLEGVIDGLPKNKVMLELDDSFVGDEVIMDEIRQLKSEGSYFIYNNYTLGSNADKLLPYCSVVKIDVKNADEFILQHLIDHLQTFNVKLLADKVEDYESLEMCKRLGFMLFQGYFLYEPRIIKSHAMETTKTNLMQLLKELNNPDITVEELDEIISRDVTLSYKLLRYLESASIMIKNRVSTIRNAIVYLGMDVIRNWANIIALSSMTDKPADLINTSLVRAKMCQLLAQKCDSDDPNSYFLAGLFSTLDAILDMSMEDIIKNMPLSDNVRAALLEEGGEIGEILQMILHYEKGDWDYVKDSDASASETSQAYLQSIQWAEHFHSSVA